MPSEAALWLVAGIVLVGVELFTGTFVLVMLGGGAVAAAVAGFFGAPMLLDAAVFVVVSLGLLFGARPALRRRMHVDPLPTGHNPIGSSGLVTLRVDRDGGQIKIDGQLWSARALDHAESFEPGQRVTVMHLSGVTAVVSSEM
ncbi:MAG TPA: NfeD family protein [Pseudonocardia sp.]|jgi:membrane protein implicated in regulation of membrane protease activity